MADGRSQQQWAETLNDGSRALIRPLTTADVAQNAAFIGALSPRSRHSLFLGGIARLSDRDLRRMCDVDHAEQMAYVAVDTHEPHEQIGVCRYAFTDPAQGAEISVAVADAWQRKGLGSRLLRHLIDYARAHGIRRLFSMDDAGNEPMRHLARRFGFAEARDSENPHQVVFSLDLSDAAGARRAGR
jgi:GNAT superfamily N-acetyltransferase